MKINDIKWIEQMNIPRTEEGYRMLTTQLKEQGIATLIAQSNTPAHYRYLDKMGFKLQGEERIKSL